MYVEEDDDVVENSWPDDKPDELGDVEENSSTALIGIILIGFGIIAESVGWFWFGWGWQSYVAEGLNFLALIVWLFGVLKWYDVTQEDTDLTTFRAWRINLLSFFVSIFASAGNVFLAWYYTNLRTFTFWSWAAALGSALGFVAIVVGVVLGWAIKSVWYNYDPEGSLAQEDFDWFKWTDVTGEEDDEEEVVDEEEEVDEEDVVDETLLAVINKTAPFTF